MLEKFKIAFLKPIPVGLNLIPKLTDESGSISRDWNGDISSKSLWWFPDMEYDVIINGAEPMFSIVIVVSEMKSQSNRG